MTKSHYNLCSKKFDVFFRESFDLTKYFEKISTLDKRHDHIESLETSRLTLKQIVHIDNKGVVAIEHDIFFDCLPVDTIILVKLLLLNRFDGVKGT